MPFLMPERVELLLILMELNSHMISYPLLVLLYLYLLIMKK
jgi:hypothetical protein